MQVIIKQTMNNNTDIRHTGGSLSRPYTFDRVVRMLITIAVIAAIVWLVDILSSVLRGRDRWFPILMTLFETVLILSMIAVFVVPSVLSEMHQVSELIGRYLETGSSVSIIPAERM